MLTADLSRLRTGGLPLTTEEATAVLLEICRSIPPATVDADVPAAEDIRVGERGEVFVDPAMAPVGDPMLALADLMEQLLPPLGTRAVGFTVPASLRVLAPRARRKPGLVPLENIGELGAALSRYETRPAGLVLRGLFRRAAAAGLVEAGAAPSAVAAPDPDPRLAPLVAPSEVEGLPEPADTRQWLLDDGPADILRPPAAPPLVASLHAPARSRRPVALASITLIFVGFVLGVLAMRALDRRSLSVDQLPSVDRIAREAGAALARVAARVASNAGIRNEPEVEKTRASLPPPAKDRPGADGATGSPGTQPTSGGPAGAGSDTASSGDTVPLTGMARESETGEAVPERMEVPGAPAAASFAGGPPLAPGQAVPLNTSAVKGPAFSPAFGPHGSTLLFHVGRNSEGRLARVTWSEDPDRPTVDRIVDASERSQHPRPSPDGRLIAFDSDRDGVRGIYVARPDGSGAERVSGPGFASVPSWSPDMRWLAFIRAEPKRPRVWNLWLRSMSTGDLRRLTSYARGQMWGASWFPDSRRVCYSHEDRLVVLDITTGRTRKYRSPRAGRLVRTPAVAPDGRRAVFQVRGDGAWLVDLESGRMQRILSDVSAEEFSWDPSGRRFAYHSRRDGTWRIWIASPPA